MYFEDYYSTFAVTQEGNSCVIDYEEYTFVFFIEI